MTFPNSVGVVGGASDTNTPTAGLSPTSNTISNPNFAVNLPAAVGTGSGGAIGLTFGSIDNTINLALRLSAAESTGMVRILSSPRVLTLDNQSARISQGTLIPYSQVSAMGVQTTFQEAKLQLLVKPHVTADGSVSMHVKLNRDEPNFNQTAANGAPTILKREAETDLLVMDGHTAVIGGIYTRNSGRTLTQVPFFGDIPDPRPSISAAPSQRSARRIGCFHYTAYRESSRSFRSLGDIVGTKSRMIRAVTSFARWPWKQGSVLLIAGASRRVELRAAARLQWIWMW